MNKYLCYIFFDEKGSAYYVGKGSEKRRIRQRHDVIIPPDERVQVFSFANEWEAFECERELIAFWGRECDGGCLQNKSIGGSNGPIGCKLVFTEDHKRKIGDAHRGKPKVKLRKQGPKPPLKKSWKCIITVKNKNTGEIRTFESRRQMARDLNIDRRCIETRGHSKGWIVV